MTKVIFDNTENRDNIGRVINSFFNEEKSCQIISAYLSENDILNDPDKIRSMKIICNARSSSTNPYILNSLLKNKNIDIKSRSDIHAKVYIFQNKVLISSANATPNGLGSGTLEAASLVESKDAVDKTHSWYESLWNDKGSENVRDFSESDWEKLKSAWNIKNGRNKLPMLIDLINTKSIPENVVFGFWHQVSDGPSKDKVSKASSKDGLIELPERIEDWDYWIEGNASEVSQESLNKTLNKHYSSVCINLKANDWPATKIYKTGHYSSRMLDRSLSYRFRNNNLLLSLYRTDKSKMPFKIDSESIDLINTSILNNPQEWRKYQKSKDGMFGYCSAEQLYKLVAKCT